jgi:periplasmic divalent cation tolerance protein
MRTVMVEITAPSPEEAERIGRTLVEEGLASCANMAGPVRSVYRWKGRVEEAAEAMLWVKTTEGALARLVDRVRALHSYECPCVTALPILGGNPDYLAWIEAECGPRHGSHAGSTAATD